ncbi:MAG: ATP-binding cassette domain-containing protein [Eubacterium sp.]|nr:ATP-binding cassette domain-containing protein [Eubacterium sp.]
METIKFDNVYFKYPLAENNALDGVTFSVNESDFIVVCGKSGCGKTTLLRHIKKSLVPYGAFSGSVTYNGCEIMDLPDRVSAAEIGFVQQNPDNQVVTDKVWHELAFGLESLGLDNATIKRRVAEMASYFNIQTWFRKDVSQLSGGQKQLMNLASIMAMQPQVLVLDEPTSQLDPIAASEFLRTVQKINRDLGTTVIISEHRLEEVFTMADKVMVMDKGKVLAYDEPRKIGSMLAGNAGSEEDKADKSCDRSRHPMFYGLPAMMKIYQSIEANGSESPLTIREGRLWIDEKVGDTYREGVPDATAHDAAGGSDGDPAIVVKDLWFRYDKRSQDVLRDLNVKVDKGQLFCVLGGNGVGKSTTLKVISHILKQQRGKVTVNGTLAMLPQNPQALFTEISVEDEMMEALHDVNEPDEVKVQKVLDMLDTMEISHLRKSHPYDLSGGEQQRLALGKVLLLDPEIILLDEATKGLDPFFKISLARVLKKLTEAGKTLFMVSHDIEFCAEYADTCAMFFDGGIVSVGKPHEFFPGNNFYTTSANKMARKHFPDAITWEEVAACIRETM